MLRKPLACLLAVGALSITASAASLPVDTGQSGQPIPTSVVTENLNGSQIVVKTFSLKPGEEPHALIEAPFDQEGYRYTFSEITQRENPFEDRRAQEQTVTVNTNSKNLSAVLAELASTIPYDDGMFKGTLSLDHTTLNTQAAGYTSKGYTATETKQIGGLTRNDPSVVPATTVKDGQTLPLTDVSWSVESSALAGDTPVPATYMATATYSKNGSYKAATGYVTTAKYAGEVISSGVSSIDYTVTYLGEKILLPPVSFPWTPVLIGGGVLLAALAGLLVFLLLLRRNTKIYVMPAGHAEYVLADKQRLTKRRLTLDLRDLRPCPTDGAVIEIRQKTAQKLFGRLITIRLNGFVRTHLIEQAETGNYWFTVSTAPDPESGPEPELEEAQ